MDRKVIIVTGANSGLGLDTAKGLCELGHDVVVSVRDDAKGEATIADITAAVPEASVMYITMEMSDPQSIRDFVMKFRATGKRLNILVNNAGLFKDYRGIQRSAAREDPSLELTMIVNCMGPFLLTHLLLQDLKSTATKEVPSRIVNISSSTTTMVKRPAGKRFIIDDLMLTGEHHYIGGMQSYRNSKLALNMWTNELADKLEGTNVIINTMCPGFIPNTGLARDNITTWSGYFVMKILDSFIGRALVKTKPVSEGRRRFIRMVVDEDTKTNGLFYCNDKPSDEAEEVLDAVNKEKIWELCVQYSDLQAEEALN